MSSSASRRTAEISPFTSPPPPPPLVPAPAPAPPPTPVPRPPPPAPRPATRAHRPARPPPHPPPQRAADLGLGLGFGLGHQPGRAALRRGQALGHDGLAQGEPPRDPGHQGQERHQHRRHRCLLSPWKRQTPSEASAATCSATMVNGVNEGAGAYLGGPARSLTRCLRKADRTNANVVVSELVGSVLVS